MTFEVVRVREPRGGPATAATHRCLWGAFVGTVTLAALAAIGIGYASLLAVAAGLLTVLPRLGPALGVLVAGAAATAVTPLLGLAAAVLVALIGLPAQHLPRWWGPLSPGGAGAAAVVGGAAYGVFGALAALVAAAIGAGLFRRLFPRPNRDPRFMPFHRRSVTPSA
jgi:predicted PurR-regulated permease PerM